MRYKYLSLITLIILASGIGLSLYRAAVAGAYDRDVILAEGYGGDIPLRLATDTEQRITGLTALAHNETPSYVADLDHFLTRFIGKGPQDPIVLGQDIDGITRATITSSGITRAVHNQLKPSPLATPRTVDPAPALIALGLLALAIAALLLKSSPLRWLAMLGGLVYFGLTEHSMLSIIQVINSATLHFPLLHVSALWLICLCLGFIPTLIMGRIYCGSLCPFALIQEMLWRALPRKFRPAAPPQALIRGTQMIKYIIAIGLMALCLLLGNASPANIEPFITLFTLHGTLFTWGLLAIMLLMGLFYFRFWCTILCPVGALTGLAARWSIYRPMPSDQCGSCGLCAKKCPTNAIERDLKGTLTVNMAECILCGECLSECGTPRNEKCCFVLKYSYEKQ